MSGQLNRLQSFLAGAGELEVIAPAPAIRPDYFSRFAKLVGATVVATHVAAAAAAPPAPALAAAPAAPVPAVTTAAPDRATTQSSILAVKKIATRYLSDGHSPLKPVITMMNPGEEIDTGPTASALAGDICSVEGIRADYGKTNALARFVMTPEQRAQVLVHESMHCRIGPALLRYVARDQSVARFALTFNESSADAMAVLMVARKDGVPAALGALEYWYKVRAAEAATPGSDGLHDSRETLKLVRDLLTMAPEQIDSDGAAFAFAITEGVAGASRTFAAALPAERRNEMTSPAFKAQMASFHQAVEEMARGYLEGPYEMGAPEITLNDQTLPSGSPAAAGTWQLMSTKNDAQPFTAASLRQRVESITASVIAAAGGAPSPAMVAAAAPASPLHAGQALAISRLKSHLNAIYVDPVPALEASQPEIDDRWIVGAEQPAM